MPIQVPRTDTRGIIRAARQGRMEANRMKRLVGGLLTVVIAFSLLGGCVSWASYPAAPGEAAVKNPNDPALIDVMTTAMEWVVRKYPPGPEQQAGARLAVNLPPGIRPRLYEALARDVGHGAVPLTRERTDLPIYHIAQVRIRGDEAAVDILRPLIELGAAPSGEPVYQEVRVNLRGGVRPWTVTSHREWTPGTVSRMPDLNFMEPPPAATPAAPAAPPAGTPEPQR